MNHEPLPLPIANYVNIVMPQMGGWCTPKKAAALAAHVLRDRPRSCLEIGVFSGRSLFAIGQALAFTASGTVVGIDPWATEESVAGFEEDPANRDWWAKLDHEAIYRECQHYRQRLGLTELVGLFRGTSEEAYPLLTLAGGGQPFLDLLHIDGNHSEEHALFDVKSYVPMVRPGGCVVFDDVNWNSTKRAQEALSEWCDFVEVVGSDKEGMCGFYTRRGVMP